MTRPVPPTTRAAAAPGQASAFTRTLVLVLIAVALAGLVNLPQPFTWDQAMFATGAQEIQRGAVLYRDFWDVKSPGIYLFYLAAGSLFGFSEVGIHFFELLYFLAFSLVVLLARRADGEHLATAGWAVLLSVGLYYAVASDWHLTQVEALAGFPLFLSLWCSHRALRAGRASGLLFALSGLAGGFAALLKLLFFPIVAALWSADLAALAARQPGRRIAAMAPALLAILAGFLLPVGLAVLYFAATRSLGLACWSTFAHPIQIVAGERSMRLGVLARGLWWFLRAWAPVAALAAIGAWHSLRARRDPLAARLLLWLGVGLAVILVQRTSWWEYHYLLLSVPLGLLAASGIEALAPGLRALVPASPPKEVRVVVAAAAVLLFSVPLGSLGLKAAKLTAHRFALTREDRFRYQCESSRAGGYAEAGTEAAFLAGPDARPGPIFVLGSPVYYWLSGRRPAVPRRWAFIESVPTGEWSRIARALRSTRPPYIFVDAEHAAILEQSRPRTDEFLDLLGHDYRVMRSSERGTWYAPGDAP